jgi:uncharacterized protein with HEPN domain
MMKLGEACNRLTRLEFDPPPEIDLALAVANRNWLIHQYDEVDRRQTWLTLSRDLANWRSSLSKAIVAAEEFLIAESYSEES